MKPKSFYTHPTEIGRWVRTSMLSQKFKVSGECRNCKIRSAGPVYFNINNNRCLCKKCFEGKTESTTRIQLAIKIPTATHKKLRQAAAENHTTVEAILIQQIDALKVKERPSIKQLNTMVEEQTYQAIRAAAGRNQTTIQALVNEALMKAGYPVSDNAQRDQRQNDAALFNDIFQA